MGKCIECGAETHAGCEKCMECSKKAMQAMFRQSPELKQAFRETIEEMRNPESIEKMAAQVTPVIQAVAALQKAALEVQHDGD